jgi:hypothetical protein
MSKPAILSACKPAPNMIYDYIMPDINDKMSQQHVFMPCAKTLLNQKIVDIICTLFYKANSENKKITVIDGMNTIRNKFFYDYLKKLTNPNARAFLREPKVVSAQNIAENLQNTTVRFEDVINILKNEFKTLLSTYDSYFIIIHQRSYPNPIAYGPTQKINFELSIEVSDNDRILYIGVPCIASEEFTAPYASKGLRDYEYSFEFDNKMNINCYQKGTNKNETDDLVLIFISSLFHVLSNTHSKEYEAVRDFYQMINIKVQILAYICKTHTCNNINSEILEGIINELKEDTTKFSAIIAEITQFINLGNSNGYIEINSKIGQLSDKLEYMTFIRTELQRIMSTVEPLLKLDKIKYYTEAQNLKIELKKYGSHVDHIEKYIKLFGEVRSKDYTIQYIKSHYANTTYIGKLMTSSLNASLFNIWSYDKYRWIQQKTPQNIIINIQALQLNEYNINEKIGNIISNNPPSSPPSFPRLSSLIISQPTLLPSASSFTSQPLVSSPISSRPSDASPFYRQPPLLPSASSFMGQPAAASPFYRQPESLPSAGSFTNQPLVSSPFYGQPATASPFYRQPQLVPSASSFTNQPLVSSPFSGQPTIASPFSSQPLVSSPFSGQPTAARSRPLLPTASSTANQEDRSAKRSKALDGDYYDTDEAHEPIIQKLGVNNNSSGSKRKADEID